MKYFIFTACTFVVMLFVFHYAGVCNKPVSYSALVDSLNKQITVLRDSISHADKQIKREIDSVTPRIAERNNFVRTIEKPVYTDDTANNWIECLAENAKLWRVVNADSMIIDDQTRIIKMQGNQINRLKLLDTINVTKLNACISENEKIQQARNKRRKFAKVAHIASALGLTYLIIKQ